ncbi:hypothetical protein AGLY_013649 [Aphis glycines]|uniref:Retrotransposon gag domain-containing protein n=1 Tax=Aphis glycines TaxID=307491 RepID=A0A6G0T6X8_APHGL|nr:hypothetical protein AGLY_013649 [Aphis glycines]
MNKEEEEENSYSENNSNSSEEEKDITREIGTQVKLNKNTEVEKLVEISINTKEVSESTQDIIKENTKGKSLLDTTLREDSSTGVEPRVLGLRSTPNIVHTELGPVRRKQRTKMSCVKATIEQVIAMIPICIDAKDALEVCRYRETSDWETIKKILQRTFEQQFSPQALQPGLNSVRMKNDEDVLTYTGRVEKLYYNLCNATLANKTPEESNILRQTLKDQALAIYINGLKMDFQKILRARNLEMLELAMQIAKQLEIEFSFNKYLQSNENKTNQNGNKNNYGNQNFNGNRWSNNYQGNSPNRQKFGHDIASCYSKQRDKRNNINHTGNGQVLKGNGICSINQLTAITEELSLNDVLPSYQ